MQVLVCNKTEPRSDKTRTRQSFRNTAAGYLSPTIGFNKTVKAERIPSMLTHKDAGVTANLRSLSWPPLLFFVPVMTSQSMEPALTEHHSDILCLEFPFCMRLFLASLISQEYHRLIPYTPSPVAGCDPKEYKCTQVGFFCFLQYGLFKRSLQ